MATTISYKWNVIENITKVSKNIAKSFDVMKSRATTFQGRLNTLPNSIANLEDKISVLNDKIRNSFDKREIKAFQLEIAKTQKQLSKMPGTSSGAGKGGSGVLASLGGIAGLASSVAGPMAAIFAVDKVLDFGGAVGSTLSEFQKYDAALTNTFGSGSSSTRVLENITKFADDNALETDKLTESYTKLANRGFAPNMSELESLGDLARSQTKDFDQLAEAVLDAETGQFERLNEFGIKATQNGNKVAFTFKGVVKEIDKSPESIRKAILEFGKMDGVKGGMKSFAETTGGMTILLSNKFNQLKLFIGKSFEPAINFIFPKIISLVGNLTSWLQGNETNIKGWGASVYNIGVTVINTFSIVGGLIYKFGELLFDLVGWIGSVFGSIMDFIINVGKTLFKYSPFNFIIYAINTVFPGVRLALIDLWGWIKDGFWGVMKWIGDNIIKPIGAFLKTISFGQIDLIENKTIKVKTEQEGEEPLSDEDFFKQLNAPKASKNNKKSLIPGIGDNPSTTGNKLNTNNLGVSEKINDLKEVRGNGKNVYITINKLVEQFIVQTTNIQEATPKIKELVVQALLSATNDANYAN